MMMSEVIYGFTRADEDDQFKKSHGWVGGQYVECWDVVEQETHYHRVPVTIFPGHIDPDVVIEILLAAANADEGDWEPEEKVCRYRFGMCYWVSQCGIAVRKPLEGRKCLVCGGRIVVEEKGTS